MNVNFSGYDDSIKRVSRPDTKLRLEHTKVAVDHDKWFREQVEIGLKEADDPNTVWVSNEDVMAMSVKRRAAWAKQAEGRAA